MLTGCGVLHEVTMLPKPLYEAFPLIQAAVDIVSMTSAYPIIPLI